MFSSCVNVTNFSETFAFCINLKTIDALFFQNFTKVTNVSGMFKHCSNLTTIPNNLFTNKSTITNFQSVFAECIVLNNISDSLFVGTGLTNIIEGFSNDVGLTTIPKLWLYHPTSSHARCFLYCPENAINYAEAATQGWVN